jgi:hypothetical protein
MTFEQFVKDYGANAIAFVALLALGYQIRSSNKQFRVLNKGYLNAMPRLDIGVDNATAVQHVRFGGDVVVSPDLPVDALNPVVNLENLGNLPLKYRIVKFDVWLRDQLLTKPLASTDNLTGVLYPKAQGTFFARPGIRPNERGPIPFGELQTLTARIYIQISYGTTKDNESMFDREMDFRWMGNGGNVVFTEIRDKW